MPEFSALLLTGLIAISASWSGLASANNDVQSPELIIENQLKKLNTPVESISPTSIPGIYQVEIQGGFVVYSSADGQYLLRGDLFEVQDNELVNLTEKIKHEHNVKLLQSINPESMIIFSPKGATKGIAYAFTDVDCGYCRKLQQEVATLNELGIEMRYLAFPRGGRQSSAYAKMANAWCATDRQQALADLKAGKTISVPIKGDQNACNKMVDDHYQLGLKLGISGTPAMVLKNGQVIPGYRPAADIARIIREQS